MVAWLHMENADIFFVPHLQHLTITLFALTKQQDFTDVISFDPLEAYLIYGLAETSHASGIIATLFGSMMMGLLVGSFCCFFFFFLGVDRFGEKYSESQKEMEMDVFFLFGIFIMGVFTRHI